MATRHHFHIGGRRDVDMTEGNIIRHLLGFAFPLLIGNVFQQLYNMVDTWVVGNFVSNEAFSAVGTVGPIINVLIGLFMGLSSGAGVVISQYYGAKQDDKVRDTVHTAILVTLLLGVAFTFLGIFLAPTMLRLTKTPADVFPESRAYLTIYFAGIIGLMVYNIGAGILRAVGDSTRPFYFLVVSAVTNTVLDLVFVLVFHMGVEGVAYATIIAQGLSAVLILITLSKSDNCVRLRLRDLKINSQMLLKILKVGIPAALQMALTSFSNVFVQSYINHFGSDVMSGWTAFNKVDSLIMLPMQSMALSATTFVGQNLGRNRIDRAKEGVRRALVVTVAVTLVIVVPLFVFSPAIVRFFNSKAEVVAFGSQFLRMVAPFHIASCATQIYAGALRGAGNSRAPMVIMLCSFVAFRQIYLFLMTQFVANTPLIVAFGYPMGWMMCSLLTTVYYHRTELKNTRLVEDAA